MELDTSASLCFEDPSGSPSFEVEFCSLAATGPSLSSRVDAGIPFQVEPSPLSPNWGCSGAVPPVY